MSAFMDNEDNTQEKPMFDNQAEYLSYLAEPDGKAFFKDINRDVTTTNLDETTIQIFILTNSIIGDVMNLKCDKSALGFFRDTSGLMNIYKSKDGFFLNKLSRQEVNKNINYSMDNEMKKRMK